MLVDANAMVWQGEGDTNLNVPRVKEQPQVNAQNVISMEV